MFGLLIAAAIGGEAIFTGPTERGIRAIIAGARDAGEATRAIDRDLVREIAGRDQSLEKWVIERLTAKNGPAGARRPEDAVKLGKIGEVDDVL